MITLGRNRRTEASMVRLGLGRLPMILMYHSVADVAEDPGGLSVAPSRFAEQMALLQRLRLRGVSIGSLVDAMRVGRERGLVGITFDDGYLNVLEAALPELKRRGFTATVFVIAGQLGGTNEWAKGLSLPLLSGSQVRELADAGMEIGSHSMTHVRLAGLAASQLQAEVSQSRASIGELVGAPVRGFAYPYGSMDATARRAVKDAGYGYACAVETPLAEFGIMALPRVYVGQRDGAARMTAKRLLYRGYLTVEAIRSQRSGVSLPPRCRLRTPDAMKERGLLTPVPSRAFMLGVSTSFTTMGSPGGSSSTRGDKWLHLRAQLADQPVRLSQPHCQLGRR